MGYIAFFNSFFLFFLQNCTVYRPTIKSIWGNVKQFIYYLEIGTNYAVSIPFSKDLKMTIPHSNIIHYRLFFFFLTFCLIFYYFFNPFFDEGSDEKIIILIDIFLN